MDDESLQQLYVWVDTIPLTRPKRNIARDFSDGGECGFTVAVKCMLDVVVLVLSRVYASVRVLKTCRRP